VEPLHDAGNVYNAQKPDVELVKAGRHAAKDLHVTSKPPSPAKCEDGRNCQNWFKAFFNMRPFGMQPDSRFQVSDQ
jgi:hypothetical protein